MIGFDYTEEHLDKELRAANKEILRLTHELEEVTETYMRLRVTCKVAADEIKRLDCELAEAKEHVQDLEKVIRSLEDTSAPLVK